MKSIVQRLEALAVVAIVMGGVAGAQDLSQQLKSVGLNGKGYLTPIFGGWAADLNSAFYHSADLHDILGFDVGLKISAARLDDADKSFTFVLPPQIDFKIGTTTYSVAAGSDYDQNILNSPTAIGDKQGKAVFLKSNPSNPSNAIIQTYLAGKPLFTTPGGYEIPAVPLVAPQIAVGLPFGLEVMGRFIPTTKLSDAGKVNFIGFGLRYDIDQWLPLFPVDIAVHFMTQKFNVKDSTDSDLISATGMAYGVEVSKRLLFITLYGGFQIEKASFTINDFTSKIGDSTIPVKGFTIDGQNSSRATVGLRLLLLFINVHAEYSIAKTPVAAVGVGITLR